MMYHSQRFKERRRYPRYPIGLPLEFQGKDGLLRGAVVCNLSEGGLLIDSIHDMPICSKLRVGVFYADEYRFDQIKVDVKIVWKICHADTDWKRYRYGLEFVEISVEDYQKLMKVMYSHLSLADVSDGLKTGRLSLSSLFP
jgi:c-di-GMP-binding flagellar brake protein YcgR